MMKGVAARIQALMGEIRRKQANLDRLIQSEGKSLIHEKENASTYPNLTSIFMTVNGSPENESDGESDGDQSIRTSASSAGSQCSSTRSSHADFWEKSEFISVLRVGAISVHSKHNM
jgi:hypothetical protein